MIEEMVLLAKKNIDEKGKSWEYKRLLDYLGQPARRAQQREFKRVHAEFPGKFLEVTKWEAIKAVIM